MADRDNPRGDATADGATSPDGTDLILLESYGLSVGSGLTVALIIWAVQNRKAIWKFTKRFFLGKGKHIGFAPGDSLCMGDWGYDQDSTLGHCDSAHGVYWQLQGGTGFRMWNTYSKGDMIAPNQNNGVPLFVHSPEDWSTWTGIGVCYVTCN